MLTIFLGFFFLLKNIWNVCIKMCIVENNFFITSTGKRTVLDWIFLASLNPQHWGAWPSDAFVFNSPSQLVIWYHWLTFLIQVRKESKTAVVKVPNSLWILSITLTISQNIKIGKMIRFGTLRIFWDKKIGYQR